MILKPIRFVTLYGMSRVLGPIAFEKTQHHYLDGLINPRRPVSPRISELIDQEVKRLVDGAHQMALQILTHNRDLLEGMAKQLLDQEVLEGLELRHYLDQIRKPIEIETWLPRSAAVLNPSR